MLNRVKSLVSAFRAKSVSGLVELFDRLKLNEFRTVADYLKYATSKVWATFKACDIVAQVVQTTPYAIYREGSKDPVKVKDLERLLRYPNEFETFGDLIYKTVFHLKITGSAYWFKAEATMLGARPKEIFGLNPKRMQIVCDQKTGTVRGYLYRIAGKDIPFDVDEIMHFKRPHPDNDHHGLGDYEAGEELVNEFVHRQEWQKKFWRNGAAPSSLLICEDQITDQEKWQEAKRKWSAEYGGEKNAGKVAWLTGKWRFERIGLTTSEMQDLEKTKLGVEQLFQLHGVPLTVAGIKEAANYATAEIDDQRFRTYTVYPVVRMIMDTMNTDLITGWGENLRIRFDVAGLVDIAKVVRDFTPLFDRGIVSINEMREKAGLPRIEDNPLFDQHFISAALVPADLAGLADMGATDGEADKAMKRFIQRTHAPKQLEAHAAV